MISVCTCGLLILISNCSVFLHNKSQMRFISLISGSSICVQVAASYNNANINLISFQSSNMRQKAHEHTTAHVMESLLIALQHAFDVYYIYSKTQPISYTTYLYFIISNLHNLLELFIVRDG
jgi:hypothetical protein